jgi:Spy/CpxP family protein refolding chaperone
MITPRILVPSVFLALSLELFAAPAFAAPPACGPHGEFSQHRGEHMKHNHQRLHDRLKLAPEQEGAWQKLMDTQGPMIKGERAKTESKAKLTTPEREEQWLERMKEHQELLTKHVVALKDFYAVLTPEQQKAFDDFHAAPRPGMHAKRAHRLSGGDAYLAAPKP